TNLVSALPFEGHDSGLHSARPRQPRSREAAGAPRNQLARSPSTSGYMTAAAAVAAALFFVLWWMLQAEESPWVPAGLAASVVMLVAAFARLLVARRAVRNRDRQAMHNSYRRAAPYRAAFTQ